MTTRQYFGYDTLELLGSLPHLTRITALRLRASDLYHPVHELTVSIADGHVTVGVTMYGTTSDDGASLGRATGELLPEYTATIGDVLGATEWQYTPARNSSAEVTAEAKLERQEPLERLLVPLLTNIDLDDLVLDLTT